MGLTGPRARDSGFIGWPGGLDVRAWDSCCAHPGQRGAPRLIRTQVQTRVWLEVEDEPDRRGPPDSEREKGEERDGLGCWAGKGEQHGWAGWATREGEKKKKAG
jgi:hypothetical protein